MPKSTPVADRFWAKVDVRDPEECWSWIAFCFPSGYGSFGGVRANRVAWKIAVGPIPEGLHVLHRCDNPPCVNPAHLFLGTHAENMADKVAKGRGRRGESHASAKLTEVDVLTLHLLRKAGLTHMQLADTFGIANRSVSAILNGRTWKHVVPPWH